MIHFRNLKTVIYKFKFFVNQITSLVIRNQTFLRATLKKSIIWNICVYELHTALTKNWNLKLSVGICIFIYLMKSLWDFFLIQGHENCCSADKASSLYSSPQLLIGSDPVISSFIFNLHSTCVLCLAFITNHVVFNQSIQLNLHYLIGYYFTTYRSHYKWLSYHPDLRVASERQFIYSDFKTTNLN